MKYIIFTLILIASFSSCKKEITISNDDYLTFGTFHGECMGNDCVKLFVIKENKLYEDPNDFNGTRLGFIPLSNEKFNQVKDLVDYIPNELFQKEKETFGCPDCVDQGGIYVRYFIEGKKGEFRFDNNLNANPTYLHEFVAKINEKLKLL